MKDAPKTIYLQVCDMDDCDDRFDMHEGVTWCQDQINDSDIEYTRADLAKREWVGLTDEEILKLIGIHIDDINEIEDWQEEIREVRAIEIKLKDKNTRNGGCS